MVSEGVVQMNRFETKSIIDKDTFRKLKWRMWRPQDLLKFLLLLIVSIAVAVWGVLSQSSTMLIAGIFGSVVLLLVILRDIVVQRNMWRRICETYNREYIEQVVSFSEDSIVVFDPASGGTVNISYLLIRRLMETPSMYYLFTKENQLVAVNKNALEQQHEKDDFLMHIKAKCTNAKLK